MDYAKDLDGWIVNAFLDLSKSPYEESELEAFLKRLACVEQLKISKNQRIVHQTNLFPIMNGKERVVLHSVERMHFIRNQLERIITPAGVSVIFFNIGLENGRGYIRCSPKDFKTYRCLLSKYSNSFEVTLLQ